MNIRDLANKVKSDPSPTRLITGNDFQDGLDLCTGNYKSDTSIFHLFLKLAKFFQIQFICTASSGNTYSIFTVRNAQQNQFNYRNYFANYTIHRPSCNDIHQGTGSSFGCNDLQDGRLSSNNVTISERVYKDIVVLQDGNRMSMTNDSQECFKVQEDINFSMIVK